MAKMKEVSVRLPFETLRFIDEIKKLSGVSRNKVMLVLLAVGAMHLKKTSRELKVKARG